MEITYYNDKKEKHQSHEMDASNSYWEMNADFSWSLSGNGADKSEACVEIKKAAELLIQDVQKFLDVNLSEVQDLPRKH